MTTRNVNNEGSILDVWAQIERGTKSDPPARLPDPLTLRESLRAKRDIFVKLVEIGYIEPEACEGIKVRVENALKELDEIIKTT